MLDVILMCIIISLQVLDIVSTYQVITSGKGTEANKAMKWLMDRIGLIPALVVSKAVFIGILVAACLIYPSMYLTIALFFVVGGYILLVINNLSIKEK